ncbi:MAG: amidohydrolase family protein, partial [Rhodospirillaceae bacterium]|nr:amidohydrolase family protein [Rhodospirillaceae bacterium]
MKSCDTLLRGTVISMDANRTAYLDGYVAVDGGRIVGVGSASECEFEGKETAGGDGHIVIPGLVNVHGHLVQGCIRGMADGTTFEERLFGFYYPMTGACDEERSYISAMPPILDLVRRGVTTTADDHFTHIHKRSIDGVLKAVRDSGMRCRMARLILSDPDNAPDGFREDLDVGLAETERVKAEWENDFTTVTASTIGITYCTPDEFKEIWQWTMDNDRQFDVHAPSVLDTRYLKERRGWEGGSFEWMDHEGILGPNVIAAHAQTLQPGE